MVPAPTSTLACKTQPRECQAGGEGLARQARDKDREGSPGQSSLGAQICLSERLTRHGQLAVALA